MKKSNKHNKNTPLDNEKLKTFSLITRRRKLRQRYNVRVVLKAMSKIYILAKYLSNIDLQILNESQSVFKFNEETMKILKENLNEKLQTS